MKRARRIVRLIAVTAAAMACPLFASGTSALSRDDRRLAEAVAAIVRADYRGDRAELARLAEALDALKLKRNGVYRE